MKTALILFAFTLRGEGTASRDERKKMIAGKRVYLSVPLGGE
jgi:hypothetical protein